MSDFGVRLLAESADRIQLRSQEMFNGEKNKEICSVEDFLIHMFGAGKSNELNFSKRSTFTLFWDRTGGDEPVISSPPRPLLGSASQEIVMLTRLLTQFDMGCPVLLQFWTPIEAKKGRRMLTVSKQPFGVGNLYYGLCMYRRHCIEMESNKDDDCGELGPPERVFRQQFPEYCPDIVCYSTEEFPTRDYAISCGIVSNWALPLFKYDEAGYQHCVGVLEFVSMEEFDFPNHVVPVIPELEELNLGRPSAHLHKCDRIREDMLLTKFGIRNVLNSVMEVHQLPLIQVWVPCMCDGEHQPNKLFCDMRICSKNLRYISEFKNYSRIYWDYYVEERKGLVGRAYSDNRPCFSRDTTQFRISDYPFFHLTRALRLNACFVIPLEFVHPTLGPLFLEIFLPPDHEHSNGNPEAVLKSLLHTVAKEFSKLNSIVGLKQDEDFWTELSYPDGENIDYFYVNRSTNVNTENTCSIRSRLNDNNAQDATDSSRRVTIEEQVLLGFLQDKQNLCGAQNRAEEQINSAVLDQYLNRDVVEDQITLDVLKPHFGSTISEVARVFEVSRSTLKRRCRELGIMRWPWHKRNKIRHIQSNPSLQQSQTLNNATEKEAPHSQFPTKNSAADGESADDFVPSSTNGDRIRSGRDADDSVPSSTNDDRIRSDREDADNDSVPSSTNDDGIRQSYDMIFKAAYRDDTVMFLLKSNCGVEVLRRELGMRFGLQAEKFKIKYKYEDEWILITCDQDLHLGLKMIKSTGKNTFNLSIIPIM